MGTLVVDRTAEDVVEIELRGTPSGLGRWGGGLLGLGLGALAWVLFKGALLRPLLPLILLAAAAVALFVWFSWPEAAARAARARIRLDARRWQVDRWFLGVRWQRREGPLDEVRGVDPDVRQPGGRHGVALMTTRRGILVASHLDATTRGRVAELVGAFLTRHGRA